VQESTERHASTDIPSTQRVAKMAAVSPELAKASLLISILDNLFLSFVIRSRLES
jgi:hypothetical protein